MPFDPSKRLPDRFDAPADNRERWQGQAIVEREIQPRKAGQIYLNNTWWLARCLQNISIAPGEIVDVVGRSGTTLIVEPAFLLKTSRAGLEKILQVCQQLYEQQDTQQHNPLDCPNLLRSTLGNSALDTWQRLIGRKPLYIDTFKQCCQLLDLDWRKIAGYSSPVKLMPGLAVPEVVNVGFVGRSQAMAELEAIRQQGAKAILILGEGGLGKTTLAAEFLRQYPAALTLEGWMAKASQNLIGAETLVQEWLQRYFGEDPTTDFRLALDRLRQKLRQQSVGVLLDNFETALDADGHLLPLHRSYVALLEVLTDPEAQSLTLITSREPIHEAVRLHTYVLPQLNLTAWTQFFQHQQIQLDAIALEQMHRAYRGNAKAMTILSSTVLLDYEGDLSAYWQTHQQNLLQETDLQKLIASQFDRLSQLYPEAYRLLCRLGCYRFQDVATLPPDGLIYLLWDVPPQQHSRILRCLRDWFLVEFDQAHYRLHPTIQAEAIVRLKASADWRSANQKAVLFWTTSVKTIHTIEDALTALEAYYHCLQISDYEAAAKIILYQRHSPWEPQEPLSVAAYRIGILQRMIQAIAQIIDRVQPGERLSKLYNHLGDLYWFTGQIQQAMQCHEQSHQIAVQFGIESLEILALFNTGLCRIDRGELSEAMLLFQRVHDRAIGTDCHIYAVGACFCLAFLHSCFQQPQIARQYVQLVLSEFAIFQGTSWGRGYSLIFLGLTYQNLHEFDRALQMYRLAQEFAEQSRYVLVQAKAFNGMATVARARGEFQTAIAHLRSARSLLDPIGAKADLAEVYYQLGLTYQKLRQPEESQASLMMAIALYQQMDAPRQVEKVKKLLS